MVRLTQQEISFHPIFSRVLTVCGLALGSALAPGKNCILTMMLQEMCLTALAALSIHSEWRQLCLTPSQHAQGLHSTTFGHLYRFLSSPLSSGCLRLLLPLYDRFWGPLQIQQGSAGWPRIGTGRWPARSPAGGSWAAGSPPSGGASGAGSPTPPCCPPCCPPGNAGTVWLPIVCCLLYLLRHVVLAGCETANLGPSCPPSMHVFR